MNTPQRSFDQVKSILGKLDRNIDAARARRTQDRALPVVLPTAITAAPPAPAMPGPVTATAASSSTQAVPGLPSTPGSPGVNGHSTFGRATPMRFARPAPLNNTGT